MIFTKPIAQFCGSTGRSNTISEIKTHGYGLKLQDRLHWKAVHHDGATDGFHSQTLRFPKEKLTVFVMSNNGNVRGDVVADEVALLLLSKGD